MSKLKGGFNYRWEYVLSPVSTTFIGVAIWNMVLLWFERSSAVEHEKSKSIIATLHQKKVNIYEYAIAIFESMYIVVAILDAAELLNRVSSGKQRHPDADRLCYTVVLGSLCSMVLRLNKAAHEKSIEMIEEEGEEHYLDWKKNTRFPVIGIFINQVFNLLGATTMVCAGGACNSLYISSITLFFSSIGISLTDWLPFLNGLGFIFVIIALFSLYSAKKDVKYPPFYLGCLFSTIILIDITGLYHSIILLVVSNVGMIGCSCYNIMNNGAPLQLGRKKKKRVAKEVSMIKIEDMRIEPDERSA